MRLFGHLQAKGTPNSFKALTQAPVEFKEVDAFVGAVVSEDASTEGVVHEMLQIKIMVILRISLSNLDTPF